MSVFFTVREDGVLDCWDILYNHNRPVLQVKIADHPLYAIKVFINVHCISSLNNCQARVQIPNGKLTKSLKE